MSLHMRWAKPSILAAAAVCVGVAAQGFWPSEWKSGIQWPEPKILDPGPVGGPPADAVVLFDGTDMSKWDGGAEWEVKDGYAEARKRGIRTKDSFGDCQLHLEFASPEVVKGNGQSRGNSGLFLMGKYELQILDSFDNVTYFDGQCGSIYKQTPPMVNVCRKPGEWQTYDVIFEAPRFQGKKLVRPGYVTLIHNGVVVQNHYELQGSTRYDRPPGYEPHGEKGPIELQFHGNPVRFRNIWIRDLQPIVGVLPAEVKTEPKPEAKPDGDKPQEKKPKQDKPKEDKLDAGKKEKKPADESTKGTKPNVKPTGDPKAEKVKAEENKPSGEAAKREAKPDQDAK